MQKFIDDETGYRAWVTDPSNTGGYIVNCHQIPVPNYLMLHTVNCPTINRLPANGAKWTEQYIKICSCDIAELEQWASHEVGGKFRACGTCKPAIKLLTAPAQHTETSISNNLSPPSKPSLMKTDNVFDIVCPNMACNGQHTFDMNTNAPMQNLICPDCNTAFRTRIVKVRSGTTRLTTRGFVDLRTFSIRVKEFNGKEDVVEFTNNGNFNFEFKASDIVGFTYFDEELCIVHNFTLNRWMPIKLANNVTVSGRGCGLPVILVFLFLFILCKSL